jgi:hypothetical protein
MYDFIHKVTLYSKVHCNVCALSKLHCISNAVHIFIFDDPDIVVSNPAMGRGDRIKSQQVWHVKVLTIGLNLQPCHR